MSTQLTFTDVPENMSATQYAKSLDKKKFEESQEKLKEEQVEIENMVKNSNGGTEQMYRGLVQRLDPELLEKFQIICSRVRWVDPDKKTILWLHDLPGDPESAHLKDQASKDRFEKIVCVSNWQMQLYNLYHGLKYDECVVLQNAIEPIDIKEKSFDGPIKLIYHTTPHRGLEILVPVYEELYKNFGDKIHLDVYSSFALYGWDQRDEPYKKLFDKCNEHEGITYHGYQPHETVVEALKTAHIFAYPSIWQETSCLSAIEAMSAKNFVVAPNFAALPETMANFGFTYQFQESRDKHAANFANTLTAVIKAMLDKKQHKTLKQELDLQKTYIDSIYNWDVRAEQWTNFLKSHV